MSCTVATSFPGSSPTRERDPGKRWSRVSQILGDNKRKHGGWAVKSEVCQYLAYPGTKATCLEKTYLVCVTRSKCRIFRQQRVYAPAGHVNLSCCRLCKSVGDNISHSKNLFAKNNRELLASVEELYGGSLSQNELLRVATLGM